MTKKNVGESTRYDLQFRMRRLLNKPDAGDGLAAPD
jgi:hypothetical protein